VFSFFLSFSILHFDSFFFFFNLTFWNCNNVVGLRFSGCSVCLRMGTSRCWGNISLLGWDQDQRNPHHEQNTESNHARNPHHEQNTESNHASFQVLGYLGFVLFLCLLERVLHLCLNLTLIQVLRNRRLTRVPCLMMIYCLAGFRFWVLTSAPYLLKG